MNAVARIEPQDQLPAAPATSIDAVLAVALSQDDVDLDRVERFLSLKREYEADEARKAYVAAMAAFKTEPLTITKDKHVSFSGTSYSHASIGNVVSVICAALGRHGFSHRWDTKQDGGLITVTCIITHARGHSESTVLSGKPDDSGKKNAIQQTASTITYLQRYTLLAATGMATTDQEDDDGRGADDGEGEKSEEQIAAEREAAAKWQAWRDAINGSADATELARQKKDLVEACGGADMVPADLRKLCVDKAHQLKSAGK